jgi:hypothetical protein
LVYFPSMEKSIYNWVYKECFNIWTIFLSFLDSRKINKLIFPFQWQ